MANPQTVQISNPYTKASRLFNQKLKEARKKNEADVMEVIEQKQFRNDWESSAYWDDSESMFFIPDTLLLACIKAGAAAARKGKDIDRAVIVTEDRAYVETEKVKSMDDAFKKIGPNGMPAFRLEGPCKIPPKTGALIWKCRCMIPTGWKLSFALEFDENIVSRIALQQAIETAGLICGIGGWRPKFGRFTVEVL